MTPGEDKDMIMDMVDNGHSHDGHGWKWWAGHGGRMDMDMVASYNIAKNSISEFANGPDSRTLGLVTT